MGNKQEQCEAAGVFSGIGAVGGIVLMALGGPILIIAGSAVLSGGMSGVSNAVQQSKDKSKKDFSCGKFLGHVVINGSVGAATAGAGAYLATAKNVVNLGKVL